MPGPGPLRVQPTQLSQHPAGASLRDPKELLHVVNTPGDGVKDSEISLRCLSQYPVVQSQVRHRSLQAAVLQLQTLQAPGLTDPETPVLAAPPIEGLLGHADPAGSLSLSELYDYLLRRMSPPSHISPFLRPDTNTLLGPVFGGAGQFCDLLHFSPTRRTPYRSFGPRLGQSRATHI